MASVADRRTAWLLVLVQFTLLGLIVLLPSGQSWTLPVGLTRACQIAAWAGVLIVLVAATALGRGLTAAPLPNQHARLRTDGLYGRVRHPIYSGVLLFAISRSLVCGDPWVGAAGGLLVLLLNVKARWRSATLPSGSWTTPPTLFEPRASSPG